MASPRPMASVTVSFGLVAIPVNVYSGAIAAERMAFNFLRASDGSRVKQQYIAVNDGEVVPRSEITKGYEFAKDQFVVFSPRELKELEDPSSKTIDITEFLPLHSVDPIYFSGTYLLAREKGGAKPHALLAMHQLHFHAEIRSMKDLDIEEAKVSEPELKLARQLIDQLAVESLDPGEFANEFNARLAAAVQRKVEGKEVPVTAEPASGRGGENVIDLMQALKRSLGARPASGAARRTPRRAVAHAARRPGRRR